jgi:hypothetical protein
MLCAVLNIPQPPTGFSIYNQTAGSAVDNVSESSIMQATREDVAEKEEDDLSHITACLMVPGENVNTHFPEWYYISYLY